MAEEFDGMVKLHGGVTQLKNHLLEFKETTAKKARKVLVEEITIFIETLEMYLQLLKTDLPPISRKALGSLMSEIEEANKFMADALKLKKFKSSWILVAMGTRSKLESRRQKLASAFQLAFIITSVDEALDGHRKTNDLQERLLELYSVHTSDSAVTRTQIQELLQPLVFEIRRKYEKMQTLLEVVQDGSRQYNVVESTDVQKFFADVLAAVDQLQNDYHLEELIYDPIYPDNLMWDPVKASDGFTYNRWTIVENDDHPDPHRTVRQSPFTRAPLTILCDDVTVRQRLYTVKKFQKENLERQSKEMREKYRTKTLELVMRGRDGEALERLEHVLKWAPEDELCQQCQDMISYHLGKSESSTGKSGSSTGKSESSPEYADESLRTAIKDLQRQYQEYEVKLELLEHEKMVDLQRQSQQYEMKLQLLEREKTELEACVSVVKSEAEAKICSVEEEVARLTAELDRLRYESKLDKQRISLLERSTENTISERVRTKSEAEAKSKLDKEKFLERFWIHSGKI